MTRERTTGPWVVAPGTVRGSVTVRAEAQKDGDFRKPVAEVWHNGDDHEANAALIAAAPDLYEAVKAYEAATVYLESYEPDMNPDRFKEVADALFAEAERLSAIAISRAESTALSGQT